MNKERTVRECQSLLFRLGIRHGVSPKLISTRLLSDDDKKDILSGEITDEQLDVIVAAWIKARMPNYRNGKTAPYWQDMDSI